jgi:hypothetical protein
MEFLSTLQRDVQLLLVAGALALLAALLSATKKNEHRFVAVFSVVMLLAGYRFHVHQLEDEARAAAKGGTSAVKQASPSVSARNSTR